MGISTWLAQPCWVSSGWAYCWLPPFSPSPLWKAEIGPWSLRISPCWTLLFECVGESIREYTPHRSFSSASACPQSFRTRLRDLPKPRRRWGRQSWRRSRDTGIFCIWGDRWHYVPSTYVCTWITKRALAGRPPSSHIEIFSANKPVHSAFLWPGGNEHEPLARTLFTRGVELLAEKVVFVGRQEMPTETFRLLPQPKTLRLFVFVPVGYLAHNIVTYTPEVIESTACSYSLSIILRAPTAKPNLRYQRYRTAWPRSPPFLRNIPCS